MKSAFLACMLCCGFALADSINPGVHMTFEKATTAVSSNAEHNTNMLYNSVSNSTYTITQQRDGYLQYVTGTSNDYLGAETGSSYQAGNKIHFNITGTTLDLSNSFTLSFAVKAAQANTTAWSHIMTMSANGKYIDFQRNSSTDNSFNMAGSGVTTTGTISNSALSNTEFQRLTLVYTAADTEVADSVGTFTLYKDGTSIGSWTSNFGNSGAITLEIGGYGGNNATQLYIDELGVYGAALTQTQIQDNLVGKAIAAIPVTTAAVPEPTTATLSLLALAGLAARRRRK